MNKEKIIIIDYGSQFTQLIARKVRELGAYSEIINFSKIKKLKKNKLLKGIVLSGGPLTATNKKTPKLNSKIISLKIPILGICYGHQILSKKLGGKVQVSKKREFGRAILKNISKYVAEGVEGIVQFKGPVNKIIYQLVGGLKSSMGYMGAKTIKNLQKKCEFVKITKAGFYESMVHNVDQIKK